MTSTNHTAADRFPAGSAAFPHKHLLGIAGLQSWEILYILQEAEHWVALNRSGAAKHDDRLSGLTIINAFFENSTRRLKSRANALALTSSICTQRNRASKRVRP
jgi:aspartate carbamoyltransferase catalytic subunit